MRSRPPLPTVDPGGAANAVRAPDRRRSALRLPADRAEAKRRDSLAPAREATG